MGNVSLVLGGTRSGKSDYAEDLAARQGPRVLYFATTRPFGRENLRRIERHRRRRPDAWKTVESAEDLLAFSAEEEPFDVLLLEDLYMWTVNRLLSAGYEDEEGWADRVSALEDRLIEEVAALVQAARVAPWALIMVSSEVGMGLPPERPRQRAFRDLLGLVNEAASKGADQVFLVVAGAALELRNARVPSST